MNIVQFVTIGSDYQSGNYYQLNYIDTNNDIGAAFNAWTPQVPAQKLVIALPLHQRAFNVLLPIIVDVPLNTVYLLNVASGPLVGPSRDVGYYTATEFCTTSWSSLVVTDPENNDIQFAEHYDGRWAARDSATSLRERAQAVISLGARGLAANSADMDDWQDACSDGAMYGVQTILRA